MKLQTQKRIAAQILKCGKNRIWFDPTRLTEIKEAITKVDIRSLIKDLAIQKKQVNSISGFRRRKALLQKRKGRRRGQGSRKGKKTARFPRKRQWINKVRAQRNFLKTLKARKLVTPPQFRDLYTKSKGGFFRSKRHIQLYLEEHQLLKK